MDLDIKKYEKIGIMGGTFDPIHNQHLYIANLALNKLNLDIVLFIPTGKTPHKDNVYITDKHHRYNMVEVAINDNDKFFISDIEKNTDTVCYTYNTLQNLKAKTNASLYFIVGHDTLDTIHTWKNLDIVASLCKIVSVSRPNYFLDKNTNVDIIKKNNLEVIIIDDISIDISSTSVRDKLFNGESVKYLIPDNVIEYIKKYDLYQKVYTPEFFDKITRDLENNISLKRFNHVLGVLETAMNLAKVYGEDVNKAKVSALLHDFSKEMPKEEKFHFLESRNIYIDDYTRKNIEISHGQISSIIAKENYNITDIDIINAIKYHTTGRENMSLLEKIILIADCTEPNRVLPDDVALITSKIRNVSLYDIDEAVLLALEIKLNFTKSKSEEIHPYGIIAYNFYKEKKWID